jgi:hypothetical protein
MKNMAHIVDNKVINVSLWDGVSEWNPEDNVIEIPEDSHAGIGWDYVDGKFIDNRPVPKISTA